MFIESHIDPEHALSDKDQQVTPEALREILDAIVWRDPNVSNQKVKLSLEELRVEIDQLDDKVMHIFDARMKVVEKIGVLKKENKITILQTVRWTDIVKSRLKFAKGKGMSEEFVMSVFKAIHQESINLQTKIMNQEG